MKYLDVIKIPQNQSESTVEEHPFIKLPFKTRLSFVPLIEKIKESVHTNSVNADFWKGILNTIESIPELNAPIDDKSILDKHKPLIDALLSSIFSIAGRQMEIRAAGAPFNFDIICSTPLFNQKLEEHNGIPKITNYNPDVLYRSKLSAAYSIILDQIYQIGEGFMENFVFTIPDLDTGINGHYHAEVNPEFIRVVPTKPVKEFSSEKLLELKKKVLEPEELSKYISADDFEFQGLAVMQLVDITESTVLSLLKDELLKKEALSSSAHFQKLENSLKDLFKLPDLKLGLVAFNPNQNTLESASPAIWNSFVGRSNQKMCSVDKEGCIYEKSIANDQPVVIEDLSQVENLGAIESYLLDEGIKNILISPLMDNGELIGVLELCSPNPGDLSNYSIPKLDNVIPLFTRAVKRKLEDITTEVELIKQKEFTAIHPTVSWKFNQAAYNLKKKRDMGVDAEMEAIIFEDVFPLFGQSDIRGSSHERNKSIQQDLLEQLSLSKNVIQIIQTKTPLPLMEEILFRIEEHENHIRAGVNAGDEVSILDFMKYEIEALFDSFKDFDPAIHEAIQQYENSLDPELKIIYNKRKDFEQSLTKINEKVSTYLDIEEARAQQMFPHYFEKYKTDGVEYNIYLGASLLKDGKFNMIYLENMRLWQLEVMSNITLKTEKLKPHLPVPLSTTQLILVHGSPLSIRFRQDEKQFDVDGAYNIRYEIVKKRIDKAYIKNTSERLTQPGKIAIVYSRDKEIEEYRRHIEFLQHKGILEKEVEFLELEELQGASGLKAIRVTVNLNRQLNGIKIKPEVAKADTTKQFQTQVG